MDSPDPAATDSLRGKLRALGRSWFALTGEEQKAVLVVLSLFLLGTVTRACLAQRRNAAADAATATAETRPARR
jgi:hypothetical protein